jgi:hypothetical protein
MRLLARTFAAVVTCATAAVPLVAAQAPPAAAAPTWAPAATAPIHPGVQTVTAGGQCTANFVFYDASNTVYIGQAAHCSGTAARPRPTVAPGSLPLAGPGRRAQPGTMVYNSWLAMQAGDQPDTCAFSDLALVG